MRLILFLTAIGIGVSLFTFIFRSQFTKNSIEPSVQQEVAVMLPAFVPEPSTKPDVSFTTYQPPKLPKKTAYTIVLLGDSMTSALGPYADELRSIIKSRYPAIDLIIENKSAPSSNIASLQDVLLGTTDPLILKPVDIIVIESFGNNPLSYMGRVEGLNVANESLTAAMKIIVREQPSALVVFLASLAPSHTMYGVGAVDLSPAQRDEWATERDMYIENHLTFAKDHNIPYVDVYHLTKDKKGSGLLKYLSPGDYIHPSQAGVLFIQQQLAKYFIDAKIFE